MDIIEEKQILLAPNHERQTFSFRTVPLEKEIILGSRKRQKNMGKIGFIIFWGILIFFVHMRHFVCINDCVVYIS